MKKNRSDRDQMRCPFIGTNSWLLCYFVQIQPRNCISNQFYACVTNRPTDGYTDKQTLFLRCDNESEKIVNMVGELRTKRTSQTKRLIKITTVIFHPIVFSISLLLFLSFPPILFLILGKGNDASLCTRKIREFFLIFFNFWRLRAAVSLWELNVVWKSFSIPFERAMMQQRSPHNSWIIAKLRFRERLKLAKSNGLVSAVEFTRHTLTPTINFGRDRISPIASK